MKSCSFGLLKNRHSILEMSILLLLLSHSLCLALSYPIGCSTLGFPVLHCPAELAQTHGHWVGDVIQATHPLSPYSLLSHNIYQHQGLFWWISSSHQEAKLLKLPLQYQCFQWIFRTDLLKDWLVWSPCSPRDSQESSLTPQFKSINSLVLSLLYGPNLTSLHDYWKNHSFDYMDLCQQSNVSAF